MRRRGRRVELEENVKKEKMVELLSDFIPTLTKEEVEETYKFINRETIDELYKTKMDWDYKMKNIATQIYLLSRIDIEKISEDDKKNILLFNTTTLEDYEKKINENKNSRIIRKNEYEEKDDYCDCDYDSVEYQTRFVDDPDVDSRLDENGIDWTCI